MKLAQIGLGAIGNIYVGHLLAADVDLVVYDIDASRLATAVSQGARAARSLDDALGDVDMVLVALPDPIAVAATLLGPGGAIALARTGTLFLDVSTIDPPTARAAYTAARAAGCDYVEAPVSGGEPMSAGTDGARNANITFMAAGDEEAFERARPLMDILGSHALYLGAAGTGTIVKLLSNLIAGLHNLVAAEAFALGRAAGLDHELLLKVFAHTDANSYWLFNYFAPRLRRADFSPGFSVDLQYKDHRLAEELARELRVPLPLNAMALQLYQMIRAQGAGGKDLVEAANFMAALGGQQRFD